MSKNKTNGTLKNSKINVKSPEVQKILAKVLKSAYDSRYLESALEKIDAKNHQKELMAMVKHRSECEYPDDVILVNALSKIKDQDFLIEFVKSHQDNKSMHGARMVALRNIKDQQFLSKFAIKTNDNVEASLAVSKIRDPELLYDIVHESVRSARCFEAAKKIPAQCQDILFQIVNDNDFRAVTEYAVKKLNDQEMLKKIIDRPFIDFDTRRIALEKIEDQIFLIRFAKCPFSNEQLALVAVSKKIQEHNLLNIVLSESVSNNIRITAISRIYNQDALFKIALREELDRFVRKAAIERIHDQKRLMEIARSKQRDNGIRLVALQQINDQEFLTRIAKKGRRVDLREVATGKVTDQEVLIEIARTDKNPNVRAAAIEHITDKAVLVELFENNQSCWEIIAKQLGII